jgi:flagellar hook-basal body complex protein FliE
MAAIPIHGISGLPGLGAGRIQGLAPRSGNTVSLSDAPLTPMEQQQTPFRDLMLGSIEEVNRLQLGADRSVEILMTGGDIGTAEVLTAVQKADIAFKMMMQIRNKLVAAFQEIQNIRV